MIRKIRPSFTKILPFAILAILAFTYRDVLRSMVLIPLAYLIFFFRLISSSIGQQALWIFFVVLAAIIAIISLAARGEKQPQEIQVEQKYPTRLKIWIESMRRNERSAYFKWNLAQDLSALFLETIAYQRGISRMQALRQIEAGKVDLPSDMIAYLQISQKPFSQTGLASDNHSNWLHKFLKKIFKHPAPKVSKSPLDMEPEIIIRYLENYLGLDPEIWQD